MSLFTLRGLRQVLGLALLSTLLSVTCHPYRIPNPTGPPRPKVHKAKKTETETAAGTNETSTTEVKPIKNSYDKREMLKKPKYNRRKLKHKVGQRKFLGITLPF